MKPFIQIVQQPRFYRLAVMLCSLVPLFLGSAWVWTFGFTNYRAHLASIGLPLGLFCVGLGLGLFFMCRWAIILSLPLAGLASLGSAVFAGFFGWRLWVVWPLWVVALVGGSYVALAGYHLFYFTASTCATKRRRTSD